ncbi:MAG: hypothetical protein V4732_14345 [Pseudomonadota bacterium]
MKKISRFECILIALLASQTLFADLLYAENIKIPVGSQMPELDNTARPKTGMTKSLVKNQFGEPTKENPAKGQPPISSWEYADFIVYFESDHVIHSVLKPKHHESTETVIEETVEMKEEDLILK